MDNNQFIDMFYAHGVKCIIKEDILRNRIASLYLETHFLPSILYQREILDMVLRKLLLKVILPDLLRCGLLLLMFLECIVLVRSIKKYSFQYIIALDNHLLP